MELRDVKPVLALALHRRALVRRALVFTLPAAGLSTSSIAGALRSLTVLPHPRPLMLISPVTFSFPITQAAAATAA